MVFLMVLPTTRPTFTLIKRILGLEIIRLGIALRHITRINPMLGHRMALNRVLLHHLSMIRIYLITHLELISILIHRRVHEEFTLTTAITRIHIGHKCITMLHLQIAPEPSGETIKRIIIYEEGQVIMRLTLFPEVLALMLIIHCTTTMAITHTMHSTLLIVITRTNPDLM